MNPTRPALRYHGGKWMLAPWIIEHFPPHRVYVEPFGGAASVLLRKPPSEIEVYNDAKAELVTLFRVLRDSSLAARLIELLRLTPYAYDEYLLSQERTSDPVEVARRLVTRSYMSVGTDAINRKGAGFRGYVGEQTGTIPAHQWVGLPDALTALVERLQGVIVENRDALYIMRQYDSPKALHYVDPPYPFSTRSHAPGVYEYEMTDSDHRDLAACLRSLKGMVVLSGYACPLYDEELYPDWRRVARNTYADGARERVEVLWLNPAASSIQSLPLFAAAKGAA